MYFGTETRNPSCYGWGFVETPEVPAVCLGCIPAATIVQEAINTTILMLHRSSSQAAAAAAPFTNS